MQSVHDVDYYTTVVVNGCARFDSVYWVVVTREEGAQREREVLGLISQSPSSDSFLCTADIRIVHVVDALVSQSN